MGKVLMLSCDFYVVVVIFYEFLLGYVFYEVDDFCALLTRRGS